MSNARLVLVLSVTPLLLAACATSEPRAAAQTPASASAQPAAGAQPAQPALAKRAITLDQLPQPDRDFLKQAVGANLAAIRFGELAANNGASIEVRSLGREMVDTNTALSEQLRTSAQTEGLVLPIAEMTPKQQKMYEELQTLSGRAFDEAFKRHVVEIQKDTIASFRNEAENGKLTEFAMFASQALPLLNQRVRTVRNQLHRM